MFLLISIVLAYSKLEIVYAVKGEIVTPGNIELGKPVAFLWSFDQAMIGHTETLSKVSHVTTLEISKLYDVGQLYEPLKVTLRPRAGDENKRLEFSSGIRKHVIAMSPGLTFGTNVTDSMGLKFRASIYVFFSKFSCMDIGTYEFVFMGINLRDPQTKYNVTKRVFMSHMFQPPSLTVVPPPGHDYLEDRLNLVCHHTNVRSSAELNFRIKLAGSKTIENLPIKGGKIHPSLKGSMWPKQKIGNLSMKTKGDCKEIIFQKYETTMIFSFKWQSIKKAEIYCEAKLISKAFQPESMSEVEVVDWTRSFLNMSTCDPKWLWNCGEQTKPKVFFYIEGISRGDFGASSINSIVQAFIVAVFLVTLAFIAVYPIYHSKKKRGDDTDSSFESKTDQPPNKRGEVTQVTEQGEATQALKGESKESTF